MLAKRTSVDARGTGPPRVERHTPGHGVQARREVGGQFLRPASRQWRWGDFRRRRFRHGVGLRPILPSDRSCSIAGTCSPSGTRTVPPPGWPRTRITSSASPTTSTRVHTILLALLAGRRWMGHRRLRAVDYNPRGTCSPIAMGLNVAMSPTVRMAPDRPRPASARSDWRRHAVLRRRASMGALPGRHRRRRVAAGPAGPAGGLPERRPPVHPQPRPQPGGIGPMTAGRYGNPQFSPSASARPRRARSRACRQARETPSRASAIRTTVAE